MGISALGTGSSILTQDLIDQLRKADEATQIRPVTLDIANEKDKKAEFDVIDAHMTNLKDAINELKTPLLFDERKAEVSGSSVEVEADANSDIQDFTLEVKNLATKEITESASYGSDTDKIATDDGSMTLSVGGKDFTINYNADMTLKDLKNAINNEAGESVTASIVKIGDDNFKLFFTAKETGDLNSDNNDDGTDDTLDISIVDNDGNLSDDDGATAGGTNLTDSMELVQSGVDAKFIYNGGDEITRSSNQIDDLISGYNIKLKSVGTSEVKVERNTEEIMKRVDSFVEKYNSAMDELSKATKASTESSTRGIFSNESAVKGMQSAIRDAFETIGEGVAKIYDFGFDLDKDGNLEFDKTTFTDKLDENSKNLEVFFSGGDFENADGSTTAIDGIFNELYTTVHDYTGTNRGLDQLKDYLNETLSSLEDKKISVTEKLDAKYDIMKKQFTAYDAMIAKLNNSSSMFTQMVNSMNANANK